MGRAAIAGPKSREVLKKLFPNSDVSNEGLAFYGLYGRRFIWSKGKNF